MKPIPASGPDPPTIRNGSSWIPALKWLLSGLICLLCGACHPYDDNRVLKIGLPEEPSSLNLFLGTDANSRKILSQIYQPLFHRHPETLDIIPWLAAEDPIIDPDALTWTVKLRPARWSDGSDFTSDDVIFTHRLFMDFKIPRYYNSWKIIKKIEAPDPHTVVFHLKEPSAVFMDRTMTAPMVSRREWEPPARKALTRDKPLRALQDTVIEKPLGTGPFVLAGYRKGAYLHMTRNPWFFGKGLTMGGMELGPHVDELLFKIYGTSDVAILALKKKDIDYYWWDIQPGYLEDLERRPHIDLFHNPKSALYFLGFNVRKPPFDDKALRQAVALAVDKNFIVSRILQGQGSPMHSVVPSGNTFWHNSAPGPFETLGLSPEQRFQAAVERLKAAGYSWESSPLTADGRKGKPSTIRLPSGREMGRVVILTPPADYDPRRAFVGIMIQEWLRNLGIQAFARPMAFNALLDTVKGKHEFDAFVMGYGQLDLDPEYVGTFFISENDQPRGWNMSGYRNPEFDALAESQRTLTDPDRRRAVIWKMQAVLMEDLPYLPLYNPHIVEAVMNERFTGWVGKIDGIGNIWSLCCVKPRPSGMDREESSR